MSTNDLNQTHNCTLYPNRVLRRRDLAAELGGICEKTVDNLVNAGKLPKPYRLNSISVWMLHDIHAFISAQAGKPRNGEAQAETTTKSTGSKTRQAAKGTAHKAGKYVV